MKFKVSLSSQLSSKIFEEKLSKQDLERLKKICESYQEFEPRKWTAASFRPYSQYFGFLTALKAKAVLDEIIESGYLKKNEPLMLYDFGCGTLGASLGAMDALISSGFNVSRLFAIDRELEGARWAQNRFEEFLPPKIEWDTKIPKLKSNSIFLMANVWNEDFLQPQKDELQLNSPAWRYLVKAIDEADESQIFVFIEPASHAINEKFLALRDLISTHTQLLLPCTHQLACPARKQEEWCHEERSYAAPNEFREIVRFLGFRQRFLSYSMLVAGKQKSRFSEEKARVVSGELGGKGRSEKWVCAKGERWKASRLLRHKNEENQEFYEARRGDIVDCKWTFDRSEG